MVLLSKHYFCLFSFSNMSKKGGRKGMTHLYEVLIQQGQTISFEYFEQIMNDIYTFLIEYDKFKNDNYHKVFQYSYMKKFKYSQAYLAKNLGMDQSTISRKLSEIRKFIILKINEIK